MRPPKRGRVQECHLIQVAWTPEGGVNFWEVPFALVVSLGWEAGGRAGRIWKSLLSKTHLLKWKDAHPFDFAGAFTNHSPIGKGDHVGKDWGEEAVSSHEGPCQQPQRRLRHLH